MNIDSLLFLFPKKKRKVRWKFTAFFYLLAYMPFILPIGALCRSMLEKTSLFFRISLKSHRCRKGHDFPADGMLDLQALGV